ncbi:hypothetical protein PAXINDRAFT_121621 [Paxillus involutus ATCC 200175]|uniref:S-adenosyl-L-methionine-dependent methyltransferase n=1 Tax=Paxillus involutus ATCC 200175 TaxID=664439 RepID=A0A0C9TGN6_PAXIN|nr:hypothetical protein PAXINDRAFT_121621 [Paxillus involutus ATCC 200175]
MTLLKRYSLLGDLFMAIKIAFWPTFKQTWANPSLLFHPTAISRIFMSHVWSVFGAGIDENSGEVKRGLVTQHAHGVVLDVGAGYGHTAKYLDKTRVTKYVALEPNVNMHDELRRAADAAGFSEASGSFVLLSCGAEDTTSILTSLGGYQPVNTIISILTLCSVPDPQDTIKSLATEVLKPGGQVLFCEHVRSPHPNIAWWQTFWTPLWGVAFDGCKLDRPTHLWTQEVGGWEKEEVWGLDGEDEEHLFLHRLGRFVKAG